VQLHRARDEIAKAGAQLVLIGQATPRHAAHFRRRFGIELPVLADERRVSYEGAGAKVASLGELLGPRVVAKGLLASARTGVVQGRTIGHAAQLGGTMLVRADGGVAWTHMSHDASDNASVEQLLDAVRAL
jgi:peroxiredoxin